MRALPLLLAPVIAAGCATPPVPSSVDLRLGEPHLRHPSLVLDLAVSPVGRWIASASFGQHGPWQDEGGALTVWDARTGLPVRTLVPSAELPRGNVSSVGFSPGGGRIFGALSTGEIRVWDVESGALLASFEAAEPVAFASDDRLVCTDPLDRRQLLELGVDGRRVLLRTLKFQVEALQVHGEAMVAGGRGPLVAGPLRGEGYGPMAGRPGEVRELRVSPDGTRVAAATEDRRVRVWSLETRAELASFDCEGREVGGLAWSPDGESLAWGDDGQIRTPGETDTRAVAPRVCITRVDGQGELRTLVGHSGAITAVAYLGAGELVSASHDGTIRIWDLATGRPRPTHAGHLDAVTSLAWSPDGTRLASAGVDGTVRVWDPTDGRLVRALDAPAPAVQVAWSAGGLLATRCRGRRQVDLWNPANGEGAGQVDLGEGSLPLGATFDPAGEHLVTVGERHRVALWSVPDGVERAAAQLATDLPAVSASPVAFVPGRPGVVVVALETQRREVVLLDLARPEAPLLRHALGAGNSVSSLAVSPAGDAVWLGTLQGRCLRLELPSGKPVWSVRVPQVTCLALSPDGARLALGHDGAHPISWLDAATGELLGRLPAAHEGTVLSLAFSPDGLRLASSGADNCPLVWIVPR